jgi:hypothetical protein
MAYTNHLRTLRGEKARNGVRYAFEDRPAWWPSTTEYSKNQCNSLQRSLLEVLHSTLIGAMKDEAPHLLLEDQGHKKDEDDDV